MGPGGQLVGHWGKKKHRLSWGRTQRLRRSWEGWAPSKVGCAVTQGTHHSSHGFGWDLAPPRSISPQLSRYTGGCISGQGSTCSSSSHDPAKPCGRDKVTGVSPRNRRCLPLLGCVRGGPGEKKNISICCLTSGRSYSRGECYTQEEEEEGTGWGCVPEPQPWAEPGWELLPPAENADDGRYSRVSLEGLRDPVGHRVQGRPGKEQPQERRFRGGEG